MKLKVYWQGNIYEHKVDNYSVLDGGVLRLYDVSRRRGKKKRKTRFLYSPPYRVERQ